jgi:hypothetical protein
MMKYWRTLLLLVVLPGCAGLDDYYPEEEYYMPAAGSCQNIVPTSQSTPVPQFTQPSAVQPAGYQTREPPL